MHNFQGASIALFNFRELSLNVSLAFSIKVELDKRFHFETVLGEVLRDSCPN